MSEKKFSKQHEWVSVAGDIATIGITKHAAEMLGDVVFVELPEVGTLIEQENPFGVVESVKTVSDLYAPVSGTVNAVNQELESSPEQVNNAPYGSGWIIEIEISDKNELEKLMSPEKYIEQCDKEQG